MTWLSAQKIFRIYKKVKLEPMTKFIKVAEYNVSTQNQLRFCMFSTNK